MTEATFVVNETLIQLAQWLLMAAFLGYLASTLLYVSGVIGKRISGGTKFVATADWGARFHLLGVILHAGAILSRWQGAGHWPTSNMFEFIGFMAFTSMAAYQVIHRIYHLPALGALVAPIGVTLLAYAYVFPPKVAPLVAPLKSIWLPLHVSMVALGEGFFAVGFGAALLYLLRLRGIEIARAAAAAPMAGGQPVAEAAGAEGLTVTAPFPPKAQRDAVSAQADVWLRRGLEFLFYLALVMVGWTILALAFRYAGFQWVFDKTTYHLPPIIGPAGEAVGSKEFLGLSLPIWEAPATWKGKNLNTMLYALVMGGLLYGLIRALLRKPIGDALAVKVRGDLELLDEISYRAVAIGYPIFTLGGLVFAMFWAKEAWGRYWFWDPKETWAFISWCVYSGYLHFRLNAGWEGKRSSWLAVLGFGVILFTLVGVNLLIVGLHSYAGGDM
jgi:ABC-type transport system involved in cytochrome c biogenesis permease subunit